MGAILHHWAAGVPVRHPSARDHRHGSPWVRSHSQAPTRSDPIAGRRSARRGRAVTPVPRATSRPAASRTETISPRSKSPADRPHATGQQTAALAQRARGAIIGTWTRSGAFRQDPAFAAFDPGALRVKARATGPPAAASTMTAARAVGDVSLLTPGMGGQLGEGSGCRCRPLPPVVSPPLCDFCECHRRSR